MDMEKKKEGKGEEEKNKNKRKRKEIAIFGNYRNYYGYRIDKDLEEDPRLKAFKREWFEGKDCLDIGCNSGVITIHIAKKFNCRSILGIDIDPDRIKDAHWHLRKFAKMESKKDPTSSNLVAKVENGVEHSANSSSNQGVDKTAEESSRVCHPIGERNLSDIVAFRQENFVQSNHPPNKYYDTIVCLSVTKWIHLNWGDDGLITFFSKIWRLLRPGGILVLEPQPWISYKKNRQVSETANKNYSNIMFHPGCFEELLLDKIGFRTVENITSSISGSKSGFDRPMFAFIK